MSEIEVKKITDRAGTGSPNFPHGVEVAGTDSGLLAPTRTEGETAPETPSNGDTFYDTANDTYDVYINDEWKRFIGEGGGLPSWTVDISQLSYDSVSFSVASQDGNPYGLAFNLDGTKMYMVGIANDTVFQYTLSTGFDLSTASYDSVSFSVSAQDGTPLDVALSNDGTKMYILGLGNDTVFQYTLSTGFDLSTASYDSVSFSVSAQDSNPYGLAFNPDGTKMYILGQTNTTVYQYTLSTGFDLSTASYDSVSFSVSGQESSPMGITLNPEGTKMYIIGLGSDRVYQYTLSTGFDLSTASYDSVSFSVSAQDGIPTGLVFSADGTKMYMSGNSNDRIYQYSTGL